MVFSTKYRTPFLDSPELRRKVFQHIKHNAAEKGIWIDCANGWQDHAHCLISIGKEQSISAIAQQIKGESSFWINKNKLTKQNFSWQDDYWAVGVSQSKVEVVRNYIHRQEEHHAKRDFLREINEFSEKHGWSLVKGK